MKRESFERACGLAAGEMMPCVSPLGYPAAKRTMREIMMRRGVNADSRMSADKLFFDGAWDAALKTAEPSMAELLELVRWAPSAVNRQPWRIIAADGAFHFYEKRDRGYVGDKTGDLQKVDLGIALCHFAAGLEAQGRAAEFTQCDPGIAVPAEAVYVATVRAGQ